MKMLIRAVMATAVVAAVSNEQSYAQNLQHSSFAPRPIASASQRLEFREATYNLRMVGSRFWRHIEGDRDMHTDARKNSQTYCYARLEPFGNQVYLTIRFRAKEMGGDFTTFDGTHRLLVYQAPPGRRVSAIVAPGGTTFSKQRISRGFHGWSNFIFNHGPSFWQSLSCQIDGNGDDDWRIGLVGKLHFNVVLE